MHIGANFEGQGEIYNNVKITEEYNYTFISCSKE